LGTDVKTAEIVDMGGAQAVRLPEEFRFDTDTVSIRREGQAVILEPVKPATWPKGFFEAIHIEDPRFARPDQGTAPAVPSLD
jgi:virulence-associated protein VagC